MEAGKLCFSALAALLFRIPKSPPSPFFLLGPGFVALSLCSQVTLIPLSENYYFLGVPSGAGSIRFLSSFSGLRPKKDTVVPLCTGFIKPGLD